MKTLTKFQSYITAAITATATSAVLASVTSIPSVPFKALLGAGTTKEELVLVTAVVTATKAITIVRAQGGSTAYAHNAKELLYHAEVIEADMGRSGRQHNLVYGQDTGSGTYVDCYGINITMTTQLTSGKYLDMLFVGIVGGSGGIASGGIMMMLWVDIMGGGTNSGTLYMLRLSQQAGGLIPSAFIQFQAADPVEHLFRIAGIWSPIIEGAVGGSQDKKIKIELSGTDYYIPCNTA